MKCDNCGNEIQLGARFCHGCGTAISFEKNNDILSSNENRVDKQKRGLVIAAILGSLILVAVLAVAIFVLPNLEVNEFKKQVESREYYDAQLSYEELEPEDITNANQWMREYISKIEQKYYDGKLDYTTAADILSEMLLFEAVFNDANEAGERVYLDNQSTLALNKAKNYFAQTLWEDALSQLTDIPIQYRFYDEVITLRQNCISNYRSSVLDKIKSCGDGGQIAEMLTLKNSALQILSNDMEIINLCQEYLDAFVSQTLSNAELLAQSKDYTGVFELLNEAKAIYPHKSFTEAFDDYLYDSVVINCEALVAENKLLEAVQYVCAMADTYPSYRDLADKYATMLVNKTLETAKSYADKRQFEQAIITITEAQAVYNCQEFQNAVSEYSKNVPKFIVDCYVVQKYSDSHIETGKWSDSLGNEYDNALKIECGGSANDLTYVVYNVDARYATLTGTIAYSTGSRYTEKQIIKIYLDNKLVYTSPTMSKTSQPVSFSVDVSGGKLLKIESTTTDDNFMTSGACVIQAKVS